MPSLTQRGSAATLLPLPVQPQHMTPVGPVGGMGRTPRHLEHQSCTVVGKQERSRPLPQVASGSWCVQSPQYNCAVRCG